MIECIKEFDSIIVDVTSITQDVVDVSVPICYMVKETDEELKRFCSSLPMNIYEIRDSNGDPKLVLTAAGNSKK